MSEIKVGIGIVMDKVPLVVEGIVLILPRARPYATPYKNRLMNLRALPLECIS